MDRLELIQGLATVGCMFIKEEDMSAVAVGNFAVACTAAFELTHPESSLLVSRMVATCIGKARKQAQ